MRNRKGGIYWKEGNLGFTLKPVVELSKGQEIPVYENTWNITEVFLKVHARPPSRETGGPQI